MFPGEVVVTLAEAREEPIERGPRVSDVRVGRHWRRIEGARNARVERVRKGLTTDSGHDRGVGFYDAPCRAFAGLASTNVRTTTRCRDEGDDRTR